MYYPKDCYTKTKGVRTRALPERGAWLVYTPRPPNLYTLNHAMYAILQLADGSPGYTIEARYLKLNVTGESVREARAGFRAALQLLEKRCILKRRPDKSMNGDNERST